MEFIKEYSHFKCTINSVTYDCHIKFEYGGCKSKYLTGNYVVLKLRKFRRKSFLIWKWEEIDFEYRYVVNISYEHFKLINGSRYFKPELVKTWVGGALRQKERETVQETASKEEEKHIKVLNEI